MQKIYRRFLTFLYQFEQRDVVRRRRKDLVSACLKNKRKRATDYTAIHRKYIHTMYECFKIQSYLSQFCVICGNNLMAQIKKPSASGGFQFYQENYLFFFLFCLRLPKILPSLKPGPSGAPIYVCAHLKPIVLEDWS